MQLRRLRVQNIRSYESADVEFGPGTTLISGDVGSGKTSLLYAVEMALFGVAEVDAAYLVRHGAAHAEVAVAFEGDGRSYEVSRRFRRLRRKGRDTFEPERIRFMVDGKETSYSATELRQQVIELLGFPDNPSPQAHSDLWRWAVYVPQERMRDILGARPQDRLETVRKALGVEKYRTAAENAQELATDLRRSATARRGEAERLRHFETEHAEGQAEAERVRNDRLALEHDATDRERAVERLRAVRAEAESRLRKLEADERELAGLEREQQADRRSLADRTQSLADRDELLHRRQKEYDDLAPDAQALEARRTELDEAEREIARLREEILRRSADLRELIEARALAASAEQQRAAARERVERDRAEVARAEAVHAEALNEGPAKEPPAPTPDDLPKLEQELASAHARETAALQASTQAETALQELEELLRVGLCPRCQQPVRPEEFASHRAEAAKAVEFAHAALETTRTDRQRVEEVRRSRERYERALERWRDVEKRRWSTTLSLEQARSDLRTTEGELRAAEEAGTAARERAVRLGPIEGSVDELRRQLDRAETGRSERARAVERASIALERREGVRRALEVMAAERSRVQREVDLLGAQIAAREARIDSLSPATVEREPLRDALGRAERELRSAEKESTTAKASLARLDAQMEEALRRVRAAEDGRRERSELLAEAAEVDEKAAWVGGPFRTAVLTMEQKLLTNAQALFERHFARYFASLVDDPGLVARTDPAFTPLVMIEGEWTPAEALSGGERTSLALAFRLALSRVVRTMGTLRLDTILLDEPTDGFSPEQVVRMGELLEELALRQVIIVSHEGQLAAIADRVVRVQKVDGRSVLADAAPAAAPELRPLAGR